LFTREDRLRIFAALMHSHGHGHAHAHTHAIARAVVESRRPAVAHGDAHVEVVKGGPAPPPPLPPDPSTTPLPSPAAWSEVVGALTDLGKRVEALAKQVDRLGKEGDQQHPHQQARR